MIENDLGADWHNYAGSMGKGCLAPREATACVNPNRKGGVALCV